MRGGTGGTEATKPLWVSVCFPLVWGGVGAGGAEGTEGREGGGHALETSEYFLLSKEVGRDGF